MEPLRALASFVSNLKYVDLPEDVVKTAVSCILDTLAAGAGAADDDQIRRITEMMEKTFGDKAEASLWGCGKKLPLFSAAFLNAMAGHTLELDDVHTDSKTHIGTVVIPAVWALAEKIKATPKQLIAAVVAGYETMSRIGMSLGVSGHRLAGWHVTGTAGVFGAAAACANLMGFSAEETLNALGLAGSQSSGVWAFLGDSASCKVLNPARAAVNGLMAVLLADAGMTGPEHILTAEDGGLFKAMTTEAFPELVSTDLGKVWEICNMDNKPYPCCRSTHCTIDGAIALKNKYGLNPEDIKNIEVYTYQVGYMQCGASDGSVNPTNPRQAKFSSPYTVAAALYSGNVTLEDFTDTAIKRAPVRKLMEKVKIIPREDFTQRYPAHWGCEEVITTADGKEYRQYIEDASGSVTQKLSNEQLLAKAKGLFVRAAKTPSDETFEKLLNLSSESVLPEI